MVNPKAHKRDEKVLECMAKLKRLGRQLAMHLKLKGWSAGMWLKATRYVGAVYIYIYIYIYI